MGKSNKPARNNNRRRTSKGRRERTRQELPVIAIVGEGLTERNYFYAVKQYVTIHANIQPALPAKQRSQYNYIFQQAEEKLNEYDYVFALIDMDYIMAQGHWNDYLRKKQQIKQLSRQTTKGHLCVCESNPCIEFWFLLHFVYTTATFPDCNAIDKQLVNYLGESPKSDVSKYTNILLDHKDQATVHAQKVLAHQNTTSAQGNPYTQVHRFFELCRKLAHQSS